MKKLIIVSFVLLLSACTSAHWGSIFAYGESASIGCYSGSVLIFKGESTGKISSQLHSDGYYFVDKNDGKLKEVSGNCIIVYK